jgi:hypothetical protein
MEGRVGGLRSVLMPEGRRAIPRVRRAHSAPWQVDR